VVALTDGPGNDTEAVWSPDGGRIAFQTDRRGDLDIEVIDLAQGRLTGIAEGPGHACYPAWTPDGGLVYAFSLHVGTALQAATAKADCGTGLRLWKAGETRVLTQGYWRDYTPSVTPDGEAVYFASTRENTGNSASLWRLALAPGAAAECVLPLDGGSVGAVQPSLAPDGRVLLWQQQDGVWNNWRLYAAPAKNLSEALALTPAEMSAYAPRWSPDGRLVAFTGFRAGAPGWGVYVLEPRSGAMGRLEAGPGNSRSPCWSPDGRALVFENDRTGVYKLYRTQVTCAPAPFRAARTTTPRQGRVEAQLVAVGGAWKLLDAAGGSVAGAAQGERALGFERPGGLDFGTGPFFVRLALVIDRHEKDTRIAAVGNYAEHALGWQVFVRENRKLCFNARQPDGTFAGVESDAELKPGKPVSVLGIRDAEGGIRLYVDGRLQRQRAGGATMAYGAARRVCLGQQWNGGMRLNGRVTAFECGRGYPAGVPRVMTRDLLFGEVSP
jgi:dipeptidyl aminopeptidase/acylaminoacyl peptidase